MVTWLLGIAAVVIMKIAQANESQSRFAPCKGHLQWANFLRGGACQGALACWPEPSWGGSGQALSTEAALPPLGDAPPPGHSLLSLLATHAVLAAPVTFPAHQSGWKPQPRFPSAWYAMALERPLPGLGSRNPTIGPKFCGRFVRGPWSRTV